MLTGASAAGTVALLLLLPVHASAATLPSVPARLSAPASFAMPQATAQATATLEGSVRDAATGAPLADVQVSIPALGLAGVTGTDGRYAIAGVRPGSYSVSFSLLGYARATSEVTLAGEERTRLDVELAVAALSLEPLIVVGSRSRPRTATESAVPIDAIPAHDLTEQGDSDLNDLLRTVIPSFNVNPQAPGDAARIVRPASLRGLAPDHTLVLVNGRRRHRASVITWSGNGFADGAQGPDISTIPAIAVRQLEVLRDGASAQYGSDAIAGVINIALRDEPSGGAFEVRTGTYQDGGGTSYTLAGNVGLSLGNEGFANLSAEFGASDPTNRSVQRDDAASLIEAGNEHVADPAQIWGSYATDNDLKLWGNFGKVLGAGLQLYGHSGYASETVKGGFFFRNPNTRAGVFSLDGGATLLVGDLLDARDGKLDGSAGCPEVRITNDRPDPVALQRVLDDPNCFTFQELFPGGFTPQYGGDTQDASLVAGVRRLTDSGLQWDASVSVGQNSVDFFIEQTVNASLGPATPTSFDPGHYLQRELGANLDLSYAPSDRVSLAGGAEWRDEYFEIGLGGRDSWILGPLAAQGFSSGSNGFPGFSEIAAGGWHRKNWAGYGEIEAVSADGRWTLGAALRMEDFEDFGSTTNGKVAARFALAERVAARASASTGFRAPTPGQQNAFNVTTAWHPQLRELVNDGTIPSTSEVAQLRGGRPLDAERSKSFSAGVVMEAGPFTASADGFRIDVSDRLSLSQVFALSREEAERLIAEGITSARNLSNFRFFTNDYTTRTRGIDLVASVGVGGGGRESARTEANVAVNFTDTEVTSYNHAIVSETRVHQLEDAIPQFRWTASLRYSWRSFLVSARTSYYSGWFDSRDARTYPGAQLVDFELQYALARGATITLGADNVLNRYPQENPNAGIAGNLYSPNSPFGYNGGYVYLKTAVRFGR